MALTTTAGGAMVGYCSMGRLEAAMPPASMMTMARTQAKTGRSMKNFDKPILFLRFHYLWHHRHVGLHFLQAFDDYAVAGLEAIQHLPVAAHSTPGLEHMQARDVLVVHDKGGGLALLVVADALLGRENAVRVHALVDGGADIETRQQKTIGIGEDRAQAHGAGRRIHR